MGGRRSRYRSPRRGGSSPTTRPSLHCGTMTWATRTSAEGEACTGATGATATRRATAGGYGGSEMATRQRPVHRSALHGEKLRNGAVGAKVNNALSSSDAQRWADVFCCCVRETPQKIK